MPHLPHTLPPITVDISGNERPTWEQDMDEFLRAITEVDTKKCVEIAEGLKIYKRTAAFVYVQLQICCGNAESTDLTRFSAVLTQWNSWDVVQSLCRHDVIRTTLWEFLQMSGTPNQCTTIGRPSLNQMLNRDEADLRSQIEDLATDQSRRQRLLSVCLENPAPLLNLLQMLLDHDTGSTGSNRSLVRMITWLAKKCGTCPDCLNLAQVQPIGSRAITGGGFADIWKGVFMDRSVALKALRVFLNDSSKKKEMVYRDFAHEAVVWRQLKHRNILPFYGIFKGHDTFDHLCLVSPWMNAGTVLNFLKHSPDSDRIALLGDVVDGLRYLHEFEPTVVHGDLKGSNVFVTPSQTACLADFGLSRFRDPQYSSGESTTESLKGTIRWQARELLIPGGDGKIARPSRESDIYAFGCVCLEIMTGDVPFSELTDVAVTFAILQNKTPQRPAGNCIKYGLDDSLWNSIEACWITEPSQRPTSVQLGQYFDQRRGTIPNDHYDSSHVTRQTLEKYGFPENYLSQIAQGMLVHRDTNNPSHFSNLGNSSLTRFRQLGEMADIEQAILNHERAIQLTPDGDPDMPRCLIDLGNSFSTRFEWRGESEDIANAISNLQRAIQLTPEGHRDKPSYLSHHGSALSTRFKHSGDKEDIEQAISNHERAIQLTPDGHPDQPSRLNNLGESLLKRFEWLGAIADIERAISNHERAIQLTPDGHPDQPGRLNDLGCSLLKRFEWLGEMYDIERAISNHERAVRLTPDGHPDQPSRLNNLGDSLLKRFEWLGVIEDIERAISNHESAIQLTPYGHPDKPRRLSNLGGSLLKRFEVLGNIEDIRRAISIHEYANKLTEDGHTDKPRLLSHLGSSFLTRFKVLGDMADVDQAIFNQEQAVQLTPDGHKEKPHRLNCLGNSLSARFSRTGSYDDLAKSIVAYRTSAHLPDGPPSTRLNAAKNWSRLAHDELRHFHPSSQSFLDAYRVAFDLLPRVAWVGLSIDSRRHELQFADTLACDAAAAAISEYDHHLALTWLEQGRSIIWGQILQLRTPIEELRHVYPNLAEELTHISEKLERSTSGDHFTTDQCNESREGALKRHRQLARDWDRIVKEVRQAPGFERFLLPKQFSELRHAARDGIVVVLNVSRYRCDALIIKSPSESFHHVRLEDFSYEKARNLSLSLRHILSDQGIRGHSADRMAYRHLGPGSEPCNDDFRDILAELWELVVRPVIESLESHQIHSKTRDEYLRIIWCPTGPLVFLPIHAAGIYNVDGTSSISLPDIAISSYTPTLTALLGNSQRATPNRSMFKLLAVIQPATPGANQLPGTLEELHMIQQHVSNSSMRILAGESATTSAVLSGMEECSWVHLACHGLHDVLHPMESGILLQDGRLKLYKVVQKRLPHAEFAFLSACQTAMGDESLPEEAVHLAAGMLLAGYRGVVATMWAITDNDTPFLAEIFYDRMMSNGQPNGCNGAEALHLAVQELRKRVGSHFLSWVPFVYVGV